MKLSILLLILSFSGHLFAGPITYMACESSQGVGYNLEVEVDILESAPPLSIIKLYKGGSFYAEQQAFREVIIQDGKVPQEIYHFIFRDVKDKAFKLLKVYLTQKIADLTYINSQGLEISILFEDCEFEY